MMTRRGARGDGSCGRRPGARPRMIALAVVAAVAGWGRSGAEDQGASVEDLMAASRYRDAYERAMQAGEAPATALAGAARALLRTSIRSEHEHLRWLGLRAARSLADPAVAAAARELLPTAGRYEMALALEVLANGDIAASRDAFLAALGSPFRTVRLRALRALAQLRAPALADRFAAILVSDPDPELRAFAARALAQTGAAATAPALYRAMDDPESLVRQEAVRALVVLRDPGIAGALRRRLGEVAPDERVRIIRLAALVPDRDLTQALGPFLCDTDAEVRAAAAGAILSIVEQAPEAAPR